MELWTIGSTINLKDRDRNWKPTERTDTFVKLVAGRSATQCDGFWSSQVRLHPLSMVASVIFWSNHGAHHWRGRRGVSGRRRQQMLP